MYNLLIQFKNVNFKYEHKTIFKNTNVDIKEGEFLFLVGESGIGKTTFLKMLYYDILPDSGNVIYDKFDSATLDKTDIPNVRQKTGIVFQDFKLLNDRNVFENIALPLNIVGEKSDIIKRKVFDVASMVGLIDKINIKPYDLSGGEQQRVAIARAIVNDPILLIADEPTGNLDPFISIDILKLLLRINMKGTTVIIATHNFELVKKFNNKRILQIKDFHLLDVRVKV